MWTRDGNNRNKGIDFFYKIYYNNSSMFLRRRALARKKDVIDCRKRIARKIKF